MCKKVLNSGEKHILSAMTFPPNYFLVSNPFFTKWSKEQLPCLNCKIMKLISRHQLRTDVVLGFGFNTVCRNSLVGTSNENRRKEKY